MSKKIIRSAAVYVGGEILNKAIPFLLLPFLTAFLSPNDFGVVATYQATLQIFLVVISLSLHGAISVLFFKVDTEKFKKILASILLLSLLSAAVAILCVGIFHGGVAQFLGVSTFWVILLPLVALFQAFSQFFLTYCQVRKEQARYVIFQSANTLLNVAASVALIAYWEVGLEGRIAGIAIAAFFFGGWALLDLKRKHHLDFCVDRSSLLIPLRFSAPLIPHSLSGWVKTSVDRLLIMFFLGAASVGEYAVMYQLAMILSIIFMAVNKALVPYLFEVLKVGGGDAIARWCFTVIVAIVLASLAFVLLVPFVFRLVISSDYQFQYLVVCLLVSGFMFQGIYLVMINFLMYHEKTKLIAQAAIINSIIHLLLAIPLVYFYGGVGAALANCCSWCILMILVFYFGARSNVYPW